MDIKQSTIDEVRDLRLADEKEYLENQKLLEKSAKEMFEELGYSNYKNREYQYYNLNSGSYVGFLDTKMFVVGNIDDKDKTDLQMLDLQELKAIQKQIEELGW